MANPYISAYPEAFIGNAKTTDDIHAQYSKILQKEGREIYQHIYNRFEEERKNTPAAGGGLNSTQQYRADSLWGAITDKYTKDGNMRDLLDVSHRLDVDPVNVLLSMMVENTLATNNLPKLYLANHTFNDVKSLDHDHYASDTKVGYQKYAEKVRSCDAGDHATAKSNNKFLREIGVDNSNCGACQKLDYVYRYLCYWAFLGELNMAGHATSYGPAQLHMESAVSVVGTPGIYGKDGVFGHEMPKLEEELYQDLDGELMSWRGAVGIVAGMLREGQDKFRAKGWDITQDSPVLATLYHIGNTGYHTAAAKPPGGTYYPSTDLFGTYSVFLRPLAMTIVKMGRDVDAGKGTWDMNTLRDMAHKIP